ncbi:hypothetical protein KEM56_000509 [Ascosphaera pollenicola]|nr:hypothetical protein KEM56_000509 [Ascosphaera pollenicola]
MSASATETETSWSTGPSPTFSRFTLRGPALPHEPVNDDALFPSFDAGYCNDVDQSSNFPPTFTHHSAQSAPQPQSHQRQQSETGYRKPLQIVTSGLDGHVLVTRDDTTIEDEPTHHVDYLTHPWSEEDVWSTWQYVLSKRSSLTAASRLENASWRCWGKCRNGGLTVPAEKIDWLKDYDVLWLYGPLISYTKPRQPENRGYGRMHSSLSSSNSTPISPTNSTISQSTPVLSNKKSILKKRTASQIILQRSLMTQTLVKHAAGILESRCDSDNEDSRFPRPSLSRQISDLSSADEIYSTSALSMASSTSSSSDSATTPTASGKRHIKFNNEVAQCIAVDCDNFDNAFGNYQGYAKEQSPARFDKYFSRGLESCILDDEDEPFSDPFIDDDDELSEDTTFFSRALHGDTGYASSLTNTNTTTPRSSFSSENSNGTNITTSTNRTIAMLPPTTLKAPADETDAEAMERPISMGPGSSFSPSPSESSGMLQSFYPSWLPKLPLPGLVRTDSTDTIRAVPASSPQPGSQPQFQINKKLMLDEDDVEEDDTKGPRVGAFKWRTPSSPTLPNEWKSPSSASFSYTDDHKFHSNSPISSDMFRPFDAFEDGEEDYIEDRLIGTGSRSPNGLRHGDDLDHDYPANYRLVDKVLDTVNTARDIAHVIWNVGWRA